MHIEERFRLNKVLIPDKDTSTVSFTTFLSFTLPPTLPSGETNQ